MNQELEANTTLSHYRIVAKLGAGGMGEVWLAEDTRLKRKVALKLLPAELTSDTDRVRRFEQEAQAASALNHPNIITVYDIGECKAGRFIVMELVAGRTLRAVIAEDNTSETLLALGAQMAKALSAAHAAGITHRDIKPDNIMVRDDGYVKVLDFGLARLRATTATDSESPTLAQQTMPGTLMGTVAYMSPEQARGETVNPSSDIFALGIVLYELATGRHPFKADTLIGYLHAITLQAPLPLGQLNPEIPAALAALILRMLEKDAGQRPTASEVAQALQEIERKNDSAKEGQREEMTLMFSPSLRPVVSPPLRHTVGREPERNELRAAFSAAQAGRGSLLCIAGEPGIGKTTLVEDFLAELAADQRNAIARGRCSERLAGTEAYLPLLEALDALLRDDPHRATTMRQLAPTWYAQVGSVSGEDSEAQKLLAEVKAASQERMKRELAAFLQAIAQARPLVIFFDDLHWADVSTIDLLSFLAGKFDVLKVLIVVTYRPSDLLLSKHPFLQIKPDLQARGVCRELLLEFLNTAEIATYLALEFPQHRFPTEFPELIHAKTEGSPLFMADLVRYLRDRGVIAAEDSGRDACAPRWLLAQTLPDIERELPESVRGMIERKIAQLSDDDRKLLTAASVQGYEFDSAVVAQVLSLAADEVEERLEKLERVFAFVKLVSEVEFPNRALTLRYRFVHVLYQNALYASLRVTRKAALSAAVAQALEVFHGTQSGNVAIELALLWKTAREYARAADHFLQAAHNAAQINAHREAVQLAERGLAALLKLPETSERNGRELGLQLTLGRSLQSVLGWAAPEARDAFNRARQLCQQTGADPLLFAALSGVAFYHFIRAELETAQGLGEQMLQLAEQSQDPVLLVMASLTWAGVHYWQGDLISAQQQFERTLALDRREYHEAYLSILNEDIGINARRILGYCLWMLGYADQALALAQEALTLAEQMSHPFSLGAAHQATGAVLAFLRDWQYSQKEFEKVFALAEEYAMGDTLNYAATQNALSLAYQEPTEAALARAKEALASLRAKGVMLVMPWHLAMLGEVFGLVGHNTEGLAAIAEALELVERTRERCYEAEIWRIKGELLLKAAADHAEASRAQAEAEGCYHQALKIARQQSAKAWELRAATSLARLWQQQGKQAEARQMLAEIYGWFTEGFATADLQDAKALLDELQQTARYGTGSGSDLVTTAVHDSEAPSRYRSPYRTDAPSIAVLPFVNISNDPDNEYFCDGLAEELLNALSKIEALRVAARTSSFSFKGKETDIREIGQRLNVSAVLEGSVRKAGNRLRITAQLVNMADGYHLWSERYDRQMEDIFDIQDEITLAIVAALKVKLLGAEKAAVVKRYTDNTEVYQLYLKGRFHFSKWTEEGVRKSVEYYEQALAQEPDYAPAFAALSRSYVLLWYFGFVTPAQGVLKAQAVATHALALDQSLAESHHAMAWLKFYYDWDWSAAEQGYQRAIELNPNYAEAHQEYGLFLAVMGRPVAALAEAMRALELAPISFLTDFYVGVTCWLAGELDRMREQGHKLIELAPGFYGGHFLIGLNLVAEGQCESAVTELESAVALGGIPIVSAWLGCVYGLVGERAKAEQMLVKFHLLSEQGFFVAYHHALVQAGLGELDRAFVFLEQAYNQREGNLVLLKHEASLIPGFSTDPRLSDLLRRIGLPQ